MKRYKELEYPWISKDSFVVTGYEFEDIEGKKYVVWAKNLTDAKWHVECKEIPGKGYLRNIKPYVTDKYNKKAECYKVHKRPFWYYGRIYRF
jgi:hypothetical protein